MVVIYGSQFVKKEEMHYTRPTHVRGKINMNHTKLVTSVNHKKLALSGY